MAQIILRNEIPASIGIVTYEITDASQSQTRLTVPSEGEVIHPVDPALGPWRVSAIVESTSPDHLATTLPEQVITTSATVNASLAMSVIQQEEALAAPHMLQAHQPTIAASPSSKEQAFNMQMQTQTNWAWAAVAASVAAYYNSHAAANITQCSLASWAFSQSNCCNTPVSSACNRPFSVADALQYVGHLNSSLAGSIPFSQVQAEIDSGQPIGVRITWNGMSLAHVVVICGYDYTQSSQPTLLIKDPWAGTTVMRFADFPARYQSGGTWTMTFLTKG